MGSLTVVFAVLVLCHTASHPARDCSVAASSAQDSSPSGDVAGLLSVLRNFAADLEHSRSNTRRPPPAADSDVSASTTNASSSGTVLESTDLTNASTIPHGSFIDAIDNGVRSSPVLRNHSIPGFGRNRLVQGFDLLSVFHNLSAVLLSNRTESNQDLEQKLKNKRNPVSDPSAASGSGSDPSSGQGVLNKTGSVPNSDPDINNRHGSNSTSNIDGISDVNPASDPDVLLRSNSSLAPVQEIPNNTMPNSGFAPVSNVTAPLVELGPIHRLTNASGSELASAVNVSDYSSTLLVDPASNLTASNHTGGRPTNRGSFSQEEFEAALREAMAKRRQRRRMSRIKEPKCVSGRDICVLELQREIPRFIKKPKGFQVKRDTRCNTGPEGGQMMECCHSLVATVNSRLQARGAATPAFPVLRRLKCTRFYCDEEECEYIGCKVDHPSSCIQLPNTTTTTTPSTTPSPSEGTGGSGGDGEGSSPSTPSSSLSTSPDPSALTGEQQKSASTTVIVVSCLLTFLAGLGGAALVFWFFRRRRLTKGSETTSSHMGSTAYIAGKDDSGDSLYETLPDGKPEHQKTTAKRSAQSTASENEYTYIPESTTPRPVHRLTSEEGTSPTYSEPGDHLVHRKLPVTPLATRAKSSLADSRSRDQKLMPASSYSLAQPVAGDFHEGYSEEGRVSFPAPHGCFVLEEDAAISGGSVPGKDIASQSPAQGDSAGDYYSSLHSPLVGGETDSQQYTALEMGGHTNPAADVDDVDSEDYSRDYLEILPEYSLQKPIG